jgi:hypothetical protein
MDNTKSTTFLLTFFLILLFGCSEKAYKERTKSESSVSNITDKYWVCSAMNNGSSDTLMCFGHRTKDSLIQRLTTSQVGLFFNSNGQYEEIQRTKEIDSKASHNGTWTRRSNSITVKYNDGSKIINYTLLPLKGNLIMLKYEVKK